MVTPVLCATLARPPSQAASHADAYRASTLPIPSPPSVGGRKICFAWVVPQAPSTNSWTACTFSASMPCAQACVTGAALTMCTLAPCVHTLSRVRTCVTA